MEPTMTTAHRQTVSGWLSEAGKAAGHTLVMDEDGHCTLLFGEGMQCVVEVTENSNLVFLYVPLLDLAEDEDLQTPVLKRALELNLFGMETGGGYLAYDERTETLLLTFSAPVDEIDSTIFSQILGDLLDAAVHLRKVFWIGSVATASG